MKCALNIARFARHCCLMALALAELSGSHSLSHRDAGRSPTQPPQALSSEAAAELAAKLANQECRRLHGKQPFTAKQYAAVLDGDLYRWGRLDPGAPDGLSALVTFRKEGTQPEVNIYFSTDILRPSRPPPPQPFNFRR
jgi:hypothetical protein